MQPEVENNPIICYTVLQMLELQRQRLQELVTGLPVDIEPAERTLDDTDELNYNLHIRAGAIGTEAWQILQNASAAKLLPLAPGYTSNRFYGEIPAMSGQSRRTIDVRLVRGQTQIKTTVERGSHIKQWDLILNGAAASSFTISEGQLVGDYQNPQRRIHTLSRMHTGPGRSSIDIRSSFPDTTNFSVLRMIHMVKDPEGNPLYLPPSYIGVEPGMPGFVGYEWDVFCYPDAEPLETRNYGVITVNPSQIARPEGYTTDKGDTYWLNAEKTGEGLLVTHGLQDHGSIETLHIPDNIAGPIMGILETELGMLDEAFQAHGAKPRRSLLIM